MRKLYATLVIMGMMLISQTAWAGTYNIDTDHSTVSFKIRHLFSYTRGTFNTFEGSLVYDPDNTNIWSAQATIQVASIDTNVEKRDSHLRSKDFFDVEKYPTITFVSTHVSDATKSNAKLHGLLTMHGVEREVVLDLDIHGVARDPWGNVLSGFTATITIDRKDFGLTWNEVLETGKLLVGEEVEIVIEVEGIAVD